MRKLPGLNDLRVFEAAARLQHFRQAADELHLTHSAVSHRVRALEAQLGVALFERQNGVTLTEAGSELYTAVAKALGILHGAVEGIGRHYASADQPLGLSVTPSFAARWLLPRLPAFQRQHPGLALAVEATVDLAELGEQGCAVAIRYGSGPWPNVEAEYVLGEYFYPVASPAFVAAHDCSSVQSLSQLPLLRHAGARGSGGSWQRFFSALGLPDQAPLMVTTFDDSNLVLQAAEQGLGIAFERHLLVDGAIRDGRLLRLFDCGMHADHAYHLVTPRNVAPTAGLTTLLAWLREQMAVSGREAEAALATVRWLA